MKQAQNNPQLLVVQWPSLLADQLKSLRLGNKKDQVGGHSYLLEAIASR